MSQITVVFKDFEEMKEFARVLLKEYPDTQDQPAAYGQQIAAHFPAANTGQATAQQAPVQAPVQQAPVQQAPVQQAPVQQAPTQQTQVQQTPVQQVPAPVQTIAPAYTLDDLSAAAMQLMDKGMQAQLLQLISQFGVDSLPHIPQEQYGNFATALRGLGAQI